MTDSLEQTIVRPQNGYRLGPVQLGWAGPGPLTITEIDYPPLDFFVNARELLSSSIWPIRFVVFAQTTWLCVETQFQGNRGRTRYCLGSPKVFHFVFL